MMTVSKDISSTDTLTAAVTPVRVLMAAGGTGGHVYPAIAIADAVRQRNPKAGILFVGTRDRMEWQTVPKAGYMIKSIWISGFHRRLTPQNLIFPFKLITSLIQSFLIITSFKPNMVVACGGFAAGPIGWVAAKMGIPILIQEQNSFPGVTSRLLAKHATTIFTAFEEAAKFLPEEKVYLAGNPVRQQLEKSPREKSLKSFGFNSDKPVLLILGGSGGAMALNGVMKQNIETLHNKLGIQVIWQCGEKYYEGITASIRTEDYPNLRLLKYIDNMSAAYGAADLTVSRAGASTCSELMMVGMPVIFVPSPNVAGNHQLKNAESMVSEGAAKMLPEKRLKKEFTEKVEQLIRDTKELERMANTMKKLAKPEAAESIAKEIYNLVRSKNG